MYVQGVYRVLDTIESAIHHIFSPFQHKPRHDKDLNFERQVFHRTTSTSYSTIPHDITRGHLHFVSAQEKCPYSQRFVDPTSENGLERERIERRRIQLAARSLESGFTVVVSGEDGVVNALSSNYGAVEEGLSTPNHG
jgi:hypothetical protein